MHKNALFSVQNQKKFRYVKIIHVFQGFFKKTIKIGNFVVVITPRNVKKKKKKKSQEIVVSRINIAVISAMKKFYKRKNGIYISFPKNKVLLLTELGELLGIKISGNIDLNLIHYSIFKDLKNSKLFI